ncbi:MAG: 23S rRNA pseudouridine(1911/1915/1917) synthase RluD [Xanthomonadales bacterium]|nr:23S rRNA pseudouridine(1911/1915/1917) synthase RluD [Gammaproteobacteria bacterium]MBT8053080.1 23S rRNA pseudouridine(1911/1915/1917) synthase RluD [Gammaproteobacteria bacterium]NND56676.1 23S rRNA pseudouridine(1911/1915/1917) synthase RluD [Xanthomonadales bacterium]NNK52661.1 23S rRNA pseudouridine(1911/1915/1917) synthase RluD [Xanthomonadales bacterium]
MPNKNEKITQSAQVDSSHAGLRLDQAAAALFLDFSRARLQKWIRSGELTVDGHKARPTYRIEGFEVLRLDAVAELSQSVAPQDIPLDIIHADSDLIIINKPAGLVVHPAAGNPDGTLQNALLHYDQNLAALPRSGIVHRLDKDTSGVMVVARSLRAHTSLVNQLQSREMSRIYRAVAKGDIVAGGTVDAPIGRHPRDRKRMAVVHSGKPAVSHYRVLKRYHGATYLEVSLESGRTHQIRVHMAHVGHPLAGDAVYGRSMKMRKGFSASVIEAMRSFPRQALHARRLCLQHPASSRKAEYEAPLPEDFIRLLSTLDACAN